MKIETQDLSIIKFLSKNISSMVLSNEMLLRNDGKSVIVRYLPKTKFEDRLPIYDINRFLSIVKLYDNPEFKVNIEKGKILFKKNKSTISYFLSDELHINPPKRIPDTEGVISFSFNIDAKTINEISRAGSILSSNDINIKISNGKGIIKSCNNKLSTANTFKIPVEGLSEDAEDCNFFILFKDFITVPEDDYKVSVSLDCEFIVMESIGELKDRFTAFIAFEDLV